MVHSRRFWILCLLALTACGAATVVVLRLQAGPAGAASVARTPRPPSRVAPRRPRAVPATIAAAQWVQASGLRADIAQVQRTTGGQVGVAVRPLGGGASINAGTLQSGTAWSTMKVPVILARYRLAESRGESTAALTARATAAVTQSDNAAVLSLFEDIVVQLGGVVPASRYIQQGLRAAGDATTEINTVPPAGGFSTFGQTQWSLDAGMRFFRALADSCLSPLDASRELLELMGEITPSQRWGLGQAPFAADAVRFKGGWGPDPTGRYLVRQFGVITAPNGRGIVVALIAKPADGTFASGIADLNELADAVAGAVNPAAAPGPTPCAAAATPGTAAVTTATATASTATPPSTPASLPLAGRTITVDPGHNGGNFEAPSIINRLVYDGNGYKPCNTTGTAAPDGYRETDFNWDVALRLRRVLLAAGAHVVMTRSSNTGVGPCINERAAIGNRGHSAAVVSIHADGGPTNGSGFAIQVPAMIPSGANDAILAPSHRLGLDMRTELLGIGLHTSTYDGHDGIAPRTDLGGLNLSRVPIVLVEVGNMQNRADEAPMQTPAYRERVAHALADGVERFLGSPAPVTR